MESIAFFRNMNLGHAGSPDRARLLRAFEDAGARSARSFQTNGTVIFTADDPGSTAVRVRGLLRDVWDDAVFVRSAARVVRLTSEFPAVDPESDHYREMVVIYNQPALQSAASDLSHDSLVRVLRMESDAAYGLIWKPRSSAGNMTALVERQLGIAATSRTLGTLRRLVGQLSA